MSTNEEQFGPNVLQFSQADYIVSESNMFQERFGDRFPEEHSKRTHEETEEFVSDDNLVHIFEEFIEEINDKGPELFNKLLLKVEKEARFNKLKKFLGKLGSDEDHAKIMDRGVNVDSSTTVDDIRGRLERFKIKTVNFGVVKEETKK